MLRRDLDGALVVAAELAHRSVTGRPTDRHVLKRGVADAGAFAISDRGSRDRVDLGGKPADTGGYLEYVLLFI